MLNSNHKDDSGATLLEYALLALLILVACVASVTFLGQDASQTFSTVGSTLASV